MLDSPTTPPAGDDQATQLYTITAGGFSATCDAFAADPDRNQLWFVSMVGAQTSLKAIWAALLNSTPSPAFLIKGAADDLHEGGYERCQVPEHSIGTWRTRLARLPQSGAWQAMVYTQMAELSFERDAFLLLSPDPADAPAVLWRFLNQRTELPLHHNSSGWLWRSGLETEAVRPLKPEGMHAWHCHHDPAQLESEISAAVRYGALTLPRDRNGAFA